MPKSCIVCGRPLKTGRKYCYRHKDYRKNTHVTKEGVLIMFLFMLIFLSYLLFINFNYFLKAVGVVVTSVTIITLLSGIAGISFTFGCLKRNLGKIPLIIILIAMCGFYLLLLILLFSINIKLSYKLFALFILLIFICFSLIFPAIKKIKEAKGLWYNQEE